MQNSVTTSGKKGRNSFGLHLFFFFSMTYIAQLLTENAGGRIIRAPEKSQEGDKGLS